MDCERILTFALGIALILMAYVIGFKEEWISNSITRSQTKIVRSLIRCVGCVCFLTGALILWVILK